jgi:heat-inducible transcriptional repressor
LAKSKAGPRLPLASKFDRASKGLSDRRTQVLYAVVTEYIRTGLPSGSRTLAETYGLDLSPATIRHVLKELEEEDFLTQPHTSAGRLPTERALRLYVDALMRVENVPPETAERIRAFFQAHRGAALEARFAEALGGLLADLSHRPALVLRSRTTSSTIRTIRFIPTRPSELLAVIVLDDATVENRFIRLDSPLDPPSLERLHNLLDELTRGRTLIEVRAHLAALAERDTRDVAELRLLGDALLRKTVAELGPSQELIITGRGSLLEKGGDAERTRQLLIVLEDRERLIRLLDRVLGSERVQVFLGREAEMAPDESLSLIAAGFEQEAGVQGALGVLGPREMNYPGLVSLVENMATAMRNLNEDKGLEASPQDRPKKDG